MKHKMPRFILTNDSQIYGISDIERKNTTYWHLKETLEIDDELVYKTKERLKHLRQLHTTRQPDIELQAPLIMQEDHDNDGSFHEIVYLKLVKNLSISSIWWLLKLPQTRVLSVHKCYKINL